MKKSILVILVIIKSGFLFATEQQPDYLIYQGKELTLATGWGHPSPLETYYSQNNIEYPFEMLHTANYRGHVAFWEISDGRLFLKEIQINGSGFKPEEFNVRAKLDSISYKDKVFSDWFTGVIIGRKHSDDNYSKIDTTYYFYVKDGKIVNTENFSESDFRRLKEISQSDTLNQDLIAKETMLNLNERYISYYFRLHRSDTIIIDNKGGYLRGNFGLSPILLYYSNDHTRWPYNWENVDKSGAPFCFWNIVNDSLLLTKVLLHTGLSFYSIDKYNVDLNEIFEAKTIDNQVFGDWISGIFIVRHGKSEEDKKLSGHFEFKVSELTYLRLKGGIVLEKYTIPSNFNFKKIPKDTDEGLKRILEEIK